jgi:hypothetical protein
MVIRESTLALPKCNGFYRMLAHKLADYYRLDHNVEPTHTGGAAVIITRTSFCGLFVYYYSCQSLQLTKN